MSEFRDNSAMPRVELIKDEARATVFQHGAHLTQWAPADTEPVIWLSAHSAWEAGKPIRGGVPICFPWFGPPHEEGAPMHGAPMHGAPMHGWARLSEWTTAEHTGGTARFMLEHDEWRLAYSVRAGRELELQLRIENAAASSRRCDAALHTYFAVGDIRRTTVSGLHGAVFVDKTQNGARRAETEEHLTIDGETDRIYFSDAAVEIRDKELQRRIVVEKTGSGATVVWNPWIAKAAAMPDFGDDEWQRMLCVETANALDCALQLGPGASHIMTVRIRIEDLKGS